MKYILIPGRFHLVTKWQIDWLKEWIEDDAVLVWAITSANLDNTRRNPVSGWRRGAMLELVCKNNFKNECLIYRVDDIGKSERFADHIIKHIEVDSRGECKLSKANTTVTSGTPEVLKMFGDLGFEAVKMPGKGTSSLWAWELIEAAAGEIQSGQDWKKTKLWREMDETCRNYWDKYRIYEMVAELFSDKLLGEDGEITSTRDFRAYLGAFDEGAKRKYESVRSYIRPGKIVDIGCGGGSILREMSHDPVLHESDLYGIEVSRELYQRCIRRKQNLEFGNDNVFFYHRNALSESCFADNSVDTITAFSITHELESYLGREKLINFIRQSERQIKPGGRLVILDVIGPENRNEKIILKLRRDDGEDEIPDLDKLSTWGLFKQFAKDFRKEEGYRLVYTITVEADDWVSVETSMYNACEFISKKDYHKSWLSEMHETFCFWSFEDWKSELSSLGLKVLPESKLITNPWIVENRYKGKVQILDLAGNPLAYPATNVLVMTTK